MPLRGVMQGGQPVTIIGRLPHKIRIVQPVPTEDSAGGWSVNNNTLVLDDYDASVEPLTAMEKFAAHEFSSDVTHAITVRHPRSLVPNPGIIKRMQVQWTDLSGRGHQFQIESVQDPDGKQNYLFLLCIEVDESLNQTVLPGAPQG